MEAINTQNLKTLNEQNDALYINIPKELKQQVDDAFASSYSQLQLNKVYFLIWKINKEVKHQINIRNYAFMLSLNTADVTKILDKLKTMLIITTDGKYSIGKTSNSYSLLKPYVLDTTRDYQIFYQSGKCDMPKWVQRYCADAGVVKAKKHSSYDNKPQPKKFKSSINEVQELKALVLKLQQENAELKARLDEQPSIGKKEVFDEPTSSINTLYSVNMQKQFKIELAPDVTCTNDFIQYLSSTITKSNLFYKKNNLGALLRGDSIKIVAA